MISNVIFFPQDQFYSFFPIALCVVGQPLNRKITKEVLSVSLRLKSYHENHPRLLLMIYVNWGNKIRKRSYLKQNTSLI